MKASDIPIKFQVAFAASASGANVRPIPLTTIDPTAASQQLGFPPETFTPLDAGGVAPDGRDMNGVLNMATAWVRWMSAGAPVPYDGAFSSTVGGYAKGAVLSAPTFGSFWISSVDDNTSNPDTGGANWVGFTPINLYAIDTGTTNAYIASFIPNYSAPVVGLPIRVKIANVNTGPATLNGVAIVQPNAAALVGGELGGINEFIFNGVQYQLSGGQRPASLPTQTVLTSGSGTYSWKIGVRYIRVRMIAGGGSGASSGSAGNNGVATSFNSVTCQPGLAGATSGEGGAGGTGGIGTTIFRAGGGPGGYGLGQAEGIVTRAKGGSGFFGGGGPGAGGASQQTSAVNNPSGGGAGEYAELQISTPASIAYTVGAGGAAVGSSVAGQNGIIIIEEHYAP